MPYRKLDKGDRLAEYVLVSKLGEGGFGEVWRAEHIHLPGKTVAIKIPRSTEHLDTIKNEATFQQQLEHPNIVRTLDLNLTSDPPYFIMEYVNGRNLRQVINEDGILPPLYAIDIATQILDALSYAHSKGIIHKDIKPENILIEKREDTIGKKRTTTHFVKVTDLGLGRVPMTPASDIVLSGNFSQTSGAKQSSGTVYYTAPEQLSPDRIIDERADIYSVGVVLYEMLTGELPLGMDLPSELNPVVPTLLDKIVKKALSIDRDLRYASADDMEIELIKARQELTQQAVPFEQRVKGKERRASHHLQTPNSQLLTHNSHLSTPQFVSRILQSAFRILYSAFRRIKEAIAGKSNPIRSKSPDTTAAPPEAERSPNGANKLLTLITILFSLLFVAVIVIAIISPSNSPLSTPNSHLSTPNSQLLTHNSHLPPPIKKEETHKDNQRNPHPPIPDSELPTPNSQLSPPNPQLYKGTILVETEPSGADVYVDGAKKGKPTPLILAGEGKHILRLQKEGYTPYESTIDIIEQNQRLLIRLDRQPSLPLPSIEVRATVVAPLYLDGKYIGKPPITLRSLSPGKYTIRMLGIEKAVAAEAGNDITINFTLTELELAYVPAGRFTMGDDKGNPDEAPAHEVTLDTYYIDKYEVTNEKYALFLNYIRASNDHSRCHPDEPKGKDHTPRFWSDKRYNEPAKPVVGVDDKRYSKPTQPVVGVDWFDCYGYAAWADKRLPTEAEWEKAARGTKNFKYPWGNEWNSMYANWGEGGNIDGSTLPAPVGSFEEGISPYGCYDMAGNVWERCFDWFNAGYYKVSPRENPQGPAQAGKTPSKTQQNLYKVIRGGSFMLDKKFAATTTRYFEGLLAASEQVGFRCAVSEGK